MSARIVIFGAHATGLNVAGHLKAARADATITLADDEPARLTEAAGLGFSTRLIDYMLDDDLKAIGIGEDNPAERVTEAFCLLPDESTNVFLILSARALDPDLHILTLSESHLSAAKLHAAGADKVINPHEIAAHRIHSILRKPIIVDILEHTVFGSADLEIAEIRIPDGCALIGKRLRDLDINREDDVIAVDLLHAAPDHGEPARSAGYSQRLTAGDTLVVVGPQTALARFRSKIG